MVLKYAKIFHQEKCYFKIQSAFHNLNNIKRNSILIITCRELFIFKWKYFNYGKKFVLNLKLKINIIILNN